jgi:hypothetical protein
VVKFQAEQPVVGAKHRTPKPVGKAQGVIHSSRRRRSVVAEQVASAMRR